MHNIIHMEQMLRSKMHCAYTHNLTNPAKAQACTCAPQPPVLVHADNITQALHHAGQHNTAQSPLTALCDMTEKWSEDAACATPCTIIRSPAHEHWSLDTVAIPQC